MPITKPDYQLSLPLDLPEVDEVLASLSPEEIRLRSEVARKNFDDVKLLKWFPEYIKLREAGWDWRVAAYIAWASSPKIGREPATQDQLATKHLGLTSDRAIATWRKKNPVIDEMITEFQSGPLWDYRPDHFEQLNLGANKAAADYKFFPYLKLAMEMRQDYIPTAKLDAYLKKNNLNKGDLKEMSDAELLKLAKNLREHMETDEPAAEEEGSDESATLS